MEIRDFFEIYADSAWHKDAAAMISLYDEQVLIFDLWNKGYIVDFSEWANNIRDWLGSLESEKVKVAFEMVNIHQSGDLAFVTTLVQYQAISVAGELLRQMKNRMTLGFKRSEAGWKVIHQHSSAPISSDGLTGNLEI